MRNLTDRIDDIKRMVSTTNQNFKRTLEIIKEMLKNSELAQVLYGEAKSIEDSINLFETNVDEEVIKTIARFQPMAINLRFLISVIKISITIERMNDLCINILKVMKHSKNISEYEQYKLIEMLEKVENMFDLFLKSYNKEDLSYSYLIISLDEEVNAYKAAVIESIKSDDRLERYELEALFISQHLERIGDSIKNLAEIVVYIYNGIDIRHGISN